MKTKKDVIPVCTSEFYYDLFDGGYIDPENLLIKKDAKKVREAIWTIIEFRETLEEAGLLEEM